VIVYGECKHQYEDEIRAKDEILLLMGNEIHRCDENLNISKLLIDEYKLLIYKYKDQ
ncbi:14761_t:CDS:1, partial [Gigaspora margarita]